MSLLKELLGLLIVESAMKIEKGLLIRAGVGFLIGEFSELAIEAFGSSVLEGGVDLPDHALGILGAAIGADKKVCEAGAKKIRKIFGKSWSELTEEEWKQFGKEHPKSADYLKAALKV